MVDSASRSWGTVIAGVQFFPPQNFEHQKPRGYQRQDLMVMPAQPIPNLVVGQTRFALAALDRFFDAVCLLRQPTLPFTNEERVA